MASAQLTLNLSPDHDNEELRSIKRDVRFVAETVSAILENLPVQRRPLSDATKALHVRAVALRRNGYCPCCQRTLVCGHDGRLPAAEFDHWFGRHRNGVTETWLVCSDCNRRLETPEFKTEKRSCFDAYQAALRPFLEDGQSDMFH